MPQVLHNLISGHKPLATTCALRVYEAYTSNHREDTARVAAKWFGSCIFILIAPIILKAFFGL
jgi:hypothetical protein